MFCSPVPTDGVNVNERAFAGTSVCDTSQRLGTLEEKLFFLDTKEYKGHRIHWEAILDAQTYFKPREIFIAQTILFMLSTFMKGGGGGKGL